MQSQLRLRSSGALTGYVSLIYNPIGCLVSLDVEEQIQFDKWLPADIIIALIYIYIYIYIAVYIYNFYILVLGDIFLSL